MPNEPTEGIELSATVCNSMAVFRGNTPGEIAFVLGQGQTEAVAVCVAPDVVGAQHLAANLISCARRVLELAGVTMTLEQAEAAYAEGQAGAAEVRALGPASVVPMLANLTNAEIAEQMPEHLRNSFRVVTHPDGRGGEAVISCREETCSLGYGDFCSFAVFPTGHPMQCTLFGQDLEAVGAVDPAKVAEATQQSPAIKAIIDAPQSHAAVVLGLGPEPRRTTQCVLADKGPIDAVTALERTRPE